MPAGKIELCANSQKTHKYSIFVIFTFYLLDLCIRTKKHQKHNNNNDDDDWWPKYTLNQ